MGHKTLKSSFVKAYIKWIRRPKLISITHSLSYIDNLNFVHFFHNMLFKPSIDDYQPKNL